MKKFWECGKTWTRAEIKADSCFTQVHVICSAHGSGDFMSQKWEGDCGLWVLNEIIFKKYAESLKKIVGAVWELPAK